MLKINTKVKKCKIPLIFACLGLGGIFLFQYLTFIPEYSSAEETNTPIMGEGRPDTRTLLEITDMQEMTSGICERSDNGESKRLRDRRDDKYYWVTKLSDGRCWMTQNMDLDLYINGSGRILVPADSDVTSSWTSNTGSSQLWSEVDVNPSRYYDPGYQIFEDGVTPNASADAENLAKSNQPDTRAHYLIGNYYSYNAATSGSGERQTANGGSVSSSICPSGWKLPTTGNIPGSFGGIGLSTLNILEQPNFFVRGGRVDPETRKVINAGRSGYFWSNIVFDEYLAYDLYFNSNTVAVDDYSYRYVGFTVRCVNNPNTPDIKIPEIDNPNVSVTVDKILTMDLTDKEVNIEPNTNEVMTGNFTATVSSNAGYDIGLSATEGSVTALVNKKDDVVIAEIPASNNIQVGTNGWGIKCIESEDCEMTNYSALTEYSNPKIYFTRQAGGINVATKFQVGIGISPDLPSGTYSTNILVTASQK